MSSETFGPTALATPANALTVTRLAMAPVLMATILERGASWVAVGLWVLLAATDGVDGWLARRQGTTRSGAFLDPLADKFLVLGGMVALVIRGDFWWLPVAVIAVREIGISVYRSWAGQRGVSIPARWGAKVKTAVQDLAVTLALVPLAAVRGGPATATLWVSVVLAVWTGAEYLAGARAIRASGRIRAV